MFDRNKSVTRSIESHQFHFAIFLFNPASTFLFLQAALPLLLLLGIDAIMAYVESTTGYGGHRDGFDDELGEDGPAMVEEQAPVGDRGFMRGSAFDGPGYDAPPAVYEDEVEGGMRGGGYGGRPARLSLPQRCLASQPKFRT